MAHNALFLLNLWQNYILDYSHRSMIGIVVLKLSPNKNKAYNNKRSDKLQYYQLFPQAALTAPQITTHITPMCVKKLGDRRKRS